MRAWWSQRNSREQNLILAASVAAILMLAWAFILHPLAERQAALQARIAAQNQALQQLAEARELQAAGAMQSTAGADFGDRSMASIIEQGLRMAGLAAAIRRIEPAGDGSVSLVLEQAGFDSLAGWLQEAAADPGITVREMSLDRAERDGTVNARMRLAASP